MYDDNREEGREQEMKATENPEDEEEVKNAKGDGVGRRHARNEIEENGEKPRWKKG